MNIMVFTLTVLCIILSATLLILIYKIMPGKLKSHKKRIDSLEVIEKDLQTKVDELEEKIANSRIDEYREFVRQFSELIDNIPDYTLKQSYEERISTLSDFMNRFVLQYSTQENQNAYRQFSRGLLAGAEAYSTILKLRETMYQLQQQLQTQENPGSEQCRKNLDMLLNVSMIAFDVITTAFANPNSREEQKLNKLLLTKEITREEALQKAKVMTSISTETPKWIRAIKDTLLLYGVKHSEVIFSGYKLVENE